MNYHIHVMVGHKCLIKTFPEYPADKYMVINVYHCKMRPGYSCQAIDRFCYFCYIDYTKGVPRYIVVEDYDDHNKTFDVSKSLYILESNFPGFMYNLFNYYAFVTRPPKALFGLRTNVEYLPPPPKQAPYFRHNHDDHQDHARVTSYALFTCLVDFERGAITFEQAIENIHYMRDYTGKRINFSDRDKVRAFFGKLLSPEIVTGVIQPGHSL